MSTVGFPRLYAAASLKRVPEAERGVHLLARFPRLYAAASLKRPHGGRARRHLRGFPRLYAAASLKRDLLLEAAQPEAAFSAALCRGLIEAATFGQALDVAIAVFRGFMPRPH